MASPIRSSQFYSELDQKLSKILSSTTDLVANFANFAACVHAAMGTNAVNWCGFYLVRQFDESKEVLSLGPFSGKPAVTLIGRGNGVCGTAWETQQHQLVPNVHENPNHIACDSGTSIQSFPLSHKSPQQPLIVKSSFQSLQMTKSMEFWT